MSDPIADLITRIKNACANNAAQVTIPFSKFKKAILQVMAENGFIGKMEEKVIDEKKYLIVDISDSVIQHMRRLSKPGQRIYVAKKDIPKPLRGMGLIIISTPRGVISGKDAAKANCGGELICEVW